jgi:hypothetical protein
MADGITSVRVRGEVKRGLGWKVDTDIVCEGLKPAGQVKTGAEGTAANKEAGALTFFYERGQAEAQKRLELYLDAFRQAGIRVLSSEIVPVENFFCCKVYYEGPERVRTEDKSYLVAAMLPAAKAAFEAKKSSLLSEGAVIIEGGAGIGGDEHGRGAYYSVTYIAAK